MNIYTEHERMMIGFERWLQAELRGNEPACVIWESMFNESVSWMLRYIYR
jgi:hypothetical protein